MTEPEEKFLARWLRLKQDSGTAQVESESPALPPHTEPSIPALEPAPFDPASLPPIDSITADSDVRAFLQDGVPAELLRAALRSTWASDPAIRDFIGVAESQWDFNDPNAMPGFGPMDPEEGARSLLARASSLPPALADTTMKQVAAAPKPISDSLNAPRPGQVDKVWLTGSDANAVDQKPPTKLAAKSETRMVDAAHTHGTALPRIVR